MATPKVYTEAEKQANRDAAAAQIAALRQTDTYKNAMGSNNTSSSSGSSSSGYTNMMGKDGNYTTVNNNLVDQYKTNGYTTDLNAAIDYNNLPQGSIYRTENQPLVGNTYVPPANLTNTPGDYKPLANTAVNGNPQYNILSEIEKAKAARVASRNAALSGVLNKTNSNLAAERGKIAPQYQSLKNNESSAAQLRAKRVSEIMAQKGYGEGYQGQTEIANNVAYRGNLGNLNTQEQGVYNDIAKRGTDAQTEYETGIAASVADADTWASEQKLAELGTQRDYARQDSQNNIQNDIAMANLTGEYNGKPIYNAQQDALNRTDKVNANLGYVNPTAGTVIPDSARQQLAQYSNDYTAYANANPNAELGRYARALANEKIFSSPDLLEKYGEAFKTAEQKQQDFNNLFTQGQFDYQKQQDTIKNTQWQQTMGLNLRQQTFAEAQQKIENALSQQRISQEGASQALQWAKFNADQDPSSLDNQYKKAQIDSLQGKYNTNTTFTIDDWGKTLDNEFIPKYDTYGDVKVPGITNAADREKRILDLGLPSDMTKALYQRYGIPLPK